MQNKGKKAWVSWIIIFFCVICVPVALLSKRDSASSKEASSSSTTASKWSFSKLAGVDKIQVIAVNGMIIDDDGKSSPFDLSGDATTTVKKIRKAMKDDHVKGILLRINSPGGTIGASQEIHEALTAFRKVKPVVTSMGDIAASGGYYIACATDKIFANPGTLTGSIGVIISLMNLKGLADKLGVQPKVIKSGPFKDITSMYRPLSEEEQKLLQGIVDDSYDQFVTAVSNGRNMKKDEVKKLADGRIYSGRQAKTLGLVDDLGSYDDALVTLQDLCKKKYNLKKDLKVDDSGTGSFLSMLLEPQSAIKIFSQAKSQDEQLLDRVLPPSLNSKFYMQPLWMLQ